MFDETAVTFDQAPFKKSAMFFNRQPIPITKDTVTRSANDATYNNANERKVA